MSYGVRKPQLSIPCIFWIAGANFAHCLSITSLIAASDMLSILEWYKRWATTRGDVIVHPLVEPHFRECSKCMDFNQIGIHTRR
jgi:hypothetical protein